MVPYASTGHKKNAATIESGAAFVLTREVWIHLTTQAPRPGLRERSTGTGALWPGSLHRIVRALDSHGASFIAVLGSESRNAGSSSASFT